jgi:hypothetical protein
VRLISRIAVPLPDPTLLWTQQRVVGMKRIFIGIAAAITVISPVSAQIPYYGTP